MPTMYTVTRTPLARDWNQRRVDGYDVVIIGSGYGGAVTAARLATAQWPDPPPTICILERGKEWLPGQFPDSLPGGLQNLRNTLNPLGLYDFRAGTDIAAVMGSGLGGTSLVNANVAIQPDDEVFKRPEWPQAIGNESGAGQLQQYYDRARFTLFASQHPDALKLGKVQALKKGGEGVANALFELHDIAVNFQFEGLNNWGVQQRKCINCGDCVTGCNVGAKNTLDTNYLAIATSGGAEIFTQVEVKHIEKDSGGGYLVHYVRRESAHGQLDQGTLKAKRMLVVAAGSLGSTEILLRSRESGLSLSDAVGTRFGGNGDFFGVAYNSDLRTDTLGWGAYPDSDRARRVQPAPNQHLNPGPTIVSRIRYNRNKGLKKRVKSEDLSVPLMYVDALRATLAFMIGRDTDPDDFFDNLKEFGRRARDFGAIDPEIEKGALNYSLAYLVNGHDDANGKIELDPTTNESRMVWPGAGGQKVFERENELLLKHATALGATFIENPSWAVTPFKTLITAHPLGGCPMSDTHTKGAVNDLGQAYDNSGNLHDGLYVADGAIMPTSLGVNPFLTISALAERRAEKLIAGLGGVPVMINSL
jgi:cholesterol oxidase